MTTFKQRVAAFWDWYPQVAQRFYDAIEAGECGSLSEEVSSFMGNNLPGLAWVFGPGEGGGHSFTVSGEGIVPIQLLAEYWNDCAVDLPNWTFYPSRQPMPGEQLKNIAIQVGERESVDTESFLIQPDVDAEEELVHIVAWHDSLAGLPENDRYQILFLLLDEALGEFGTQSWLGEIKVDRFTPDNKTKTLPELSEFIQQVQAYHEWNIVPPLEGLSLYELKTNIDCPRGDTVVGTTVIPQVISSFLNGQGALDENPLEGTGAQFAYLAIDRGVFPEGKELDVRTNIEEAVDDALRQQRSGRTLGGAFGSENGYIDLILFDGDQSCAVIEDTLQRLQLHNRASVHEMI